MLMADHLQALRMYSRCLPDNTVPGTQQLIFRRMYNPGCLLMRGFINTWSKKTEGITRMSCSPQFCYWHLQGGVKGYVHTAGSGAQNLTHTVSDYFYNSLNSTHLFFRSSNLRPSRPLSYVVLNQIHIFIIVCLSSIKGWG